MAWWPRLCPAPAAEPPPTLGKCKLTYFPVFAKGPGPALALAHSGLDFEIANPEDWASMKPTTPWGHLPLLEVGTLVIGHELAILSVIGRQSCKMGGAGSAEFAVSQQLMSQAEDIYQKIQK